MYPVVGLRLYVERNGGTKSTLEKYNVFWSVVWLKSFPRDNNILTNCNSINEFTTLMFSLLFIFFGFFYEQNL